jgi:hypothetical protein
MRKKIVIGIFAVLVVVFGVSSYNVLKILWDNRQVEKTYKSLQSQYVTALPTQPEVTQGPANTEPIAPQPAKLAVNFEGVWEINRDVVGWLSIEGVVDEPVFQRDNSRSLHTGQALHIGADAAGIQIA